MSSTDTAAMAVGTAADTAGTVEATEDKG
jgi:hypothetical protein